LDWDSKHFGLEIAQIDRPPDDEEQIAGLMREAQDRNIDCIYCLLDADDHARAWRLEDAGFVTRDLRLEFILSLDRARLDAGPDVGVLRPCVDADVDRLAALASSAFEGTRFAADPYFPRSRVASLYDVWLRNSVAGFADAVLVLGTVGRPSGFVTLHSDGAKARIGLIAVDPQSRGNRYGRTLVAGARQWAIERGCTELRVITQGSNTAAQRLYQNCGFVTNSVQIWLHAWPRLTCDARPKRFEP
jgi:ribosomal protein S18 acetylase RimI-like enzyme